MRGDTEATDLECELRSNVGRVRRKSGEGFGRFPDYEHSLK